MSTGQPAPAAPVPESQHAEIGGDTAAVTDQPGIPGTAPQRGETGTSSRLEPRGKGLLGVTLRYPYEVRNEADYFDDIPDEKNPKDMLDLASHIVKTKAGHFEPSKFEEQYEDALKELLKKKQEGKPIERPERPKPTNVVNLMDALRRSVEASGTATSSKAKGRAAAPRSSSEKAEHPKRKKTRRTG